MNKNEYYRFGSNLNANIAIDEEKAKKGDVDAMIRLARYFRTGATIAFDYQNEEDEVGFWFKSKAENGDIIISQDFWGEYKADKVDFLKGKKYAKLAADSNNPDGLYIYSLYLLESLEYDNEDFAKLNCLKKQQNMPIPVDKAEIDGLSGDKEKYIKIGEDTWYRAKTDDEINEDKKQIFELEQKCSDAKRIVESDAQVYLIKAVDLGCTEAKIELAKYYVKGKSFFDGTNKPVQEDFDKAEQLLLDVTSTDDSLRSAYFLLAEIYKNKENQSYNESKMLDCYAKLDAWKLYMAADVSGAVLSDHLATLMVSEIYLSTEFYAELTVLSKNIVELVAAKLNKTKLIDFCAAIIEWGGNLYEIKNSDESTSFVYGVLDELAKQGNADAQYKLGRALAYRKNSESSLNTAQGCIEKEEYLKIASRWIDEACKNGHQGALDFKSMRDETLSLEEVGSLIENTDTFYYTAFFRAYRNIEVGNYKEAFECFIKIMERRQTLSHARDALELCEKMNDGSAEKFVSQFFDWAIEHEIKNERSYFEGDFILDELIPRVLDKHSKYYNPSYAIRILQSNEFSAPEGYYKLGCIYSDGEHVEKNYKQALKYFKLAAKEDVGEAYYKLGYLYYYGDGGLNPEPLRAKEYFEKAIFCGINCEYAYEMVRADLNEKDNENPMKEYADLVIVETPRGAERNARFQDDMANEFGEYWEKLNENTRGFIYSGIKTYVNNYEDDDPIFDFSAAINPMAKSLETLLGDIFYTKYKQWLRVNGVSNIKEYFESLGARVSSDKDPFELGVFRFIAYERNAVNTDYETTRKLIRANKLPAIIRKSGKTIYKLQLHEKFAEYANDIFKEDAFSSDERMQEITAFIINLVSQVEVIREDLRNRASHDTVMKAMHAEKCGNILYKTKKLLYSLISKIKE